MATIVSCPNCREQVTLPLEPYTVLICPHCQAEFSMQPTLRRDEGLGAQPGIGPLRHERLQEARQTFAPRRAAAPLPGLESLEVQPLRQPYKQPRPRGGFFSMMGHLIGLLGGGALGLVAGYYLLNWFGGPQFNVLEIPLPGIPHTQSAQQTAPDVRLQPAAGPRDKAAPLSPKREAPAATSTANSPRAGGPQLMAPLVRQASASEPPSEASNTSSRVLEAAAALPPPAVSLEDLTAALASAREALACRECKSCGFVTRTASGRSAPRLPCPACRGRGTSGITSDVYDKLCRLASAVTHVDAKSDSVAAVQGEVRALFSKATDRSDQQASIGRQAAQRIADGKRTSDGVLLAGTITEKSLQGRYHLTRIVLLGQPAPVAVLSSKPIPFQPGERVAVAGCIVQHPADEIEDYRGENSPLVWGGLPLRVE
jgi:hypothetical protein